MANPPPPFVRVQQLLNPPHYMVLIATQGRTDIGDMIWLDTIAPEGTVYFCVRIENVYVRAPPATGPHPRRFVRVR